MRWTRNRLDRTIPETSEGSKAESQEHREARSRTPTTILTIALADPSHEEHDELRDWAPRGFDPERFSADAVVFHDPKRRLRAVLR